MEDKIVKYTWDPSNMAIYHQYCEFQCKFHSFFVGFFLQTSLKFVGGNDNNIHILKKEGETNQQKKIDSVKANQNHKPYISFLFAMYIVSFY